MAETQHLVRIANGAITGTGSDVRVYRGIPFAAPPVGPLRWQPPQPVVPWSGVHDGSRFGYDPMQFPATEPARRSRAPGCSEDCLTLNVWAPADVPAGGAPVIVAFDRGGFVAGSASPERTDGSAYARRGVVLVNANYRVGVFGFLSHPKLSAESPHQASGNYGFLDAIAALRWVHENIAAFGGDPARVTVTGQSAGAVMTTLLPTSPLTEGLIARVISRSGSSFHAMHTLAEAEAACRAVVGDDLAALRATPAADLLALNGTIDRGLRDLMTQVYLRPLIDGWSVVRDEIDAYRSGAYAPVPAIVGQTTDEAGGRITAGYPVKTTAELRAYLAQSFGADIDEAWTHYGAATDAGVAQALGDVWSDDMFSYGIRGFAREAAKRQPKTFRYVFTHAGSGTATPPQHGNDTPYAFGTGNFEGRDRTVSDAMLSAFCNFAATGDPNGPGAPPWTPYDAARDNYLEFGGTFNEGTNWRTAQIDFFDRLYDRRRARVGASSS
jgi:para-nitrobenzyl esterase